LGGGVKIKQKSKKTVPGQKRRWGVNKGVDARRALPQQKGGKKNREEDGSGLCKIAFCGRRNRKKQEEEKKLRAKNKEINI